MQKNASVSFAFNITLFKFLKIGKKHLTNSTSNAILCKITKLIEPQPWLHALSFLQGFHFEEGFPCAIY